MTDERLYRELERAAEAFADSLDTATLRSLPPVAREALMSLADRLDALKRHRRGDVVSEALRPS